MSNAARAVLIDYLLAHGWEQADSGPAGELWARGDTYTVVPRDIAADTSPWLRLAGVLAQYQGESPDELLSLWRRMVSEARDLHEAGIPRARRLAGRVELETHLDGPTVRDHETSAYYFGRFVMRTADAVKEVVKSTRGLRHQSRELLVVGGPREGSVSVTFREPDRSDPRALVPEAPETIEGRALVLLASILSAAERATDLNEADGLRSHLAPLNARARAGLATLAPTLSWTADGSS